MTEREPDLNENPESDLTENAESPEEKQEFSFLDEHVKDRPLQMKKLLGRALQAAVLGLVFGFMAYLAFGVIAPGIKEKRNAGKNQEVTITQDEQEEPGANADTADTGSEDSEDDAGGDTSDEGTTPPADEPEDEPEEEPEEEPEPLVLGVDNYAQMLSDLNRVVQGTKNYVVTVTGIHEGKDSFSGMYLDPVKAGGIIAAETDTELLILTSSLVLKDTGDLHVTFSNGQTFPAELKMDEAGTKMAVLSIKKSNLTTSTKDFIKVAPLGNSYSITSGVPVIAEGCLFGTEHAVAYGVISSVSKEYSPADSAFHLLTSDLGGSSEASGVFINTAGEVVGFILPEGSGTNTISAIPISDIKNAIESLSNGAAVPYMGVYGIDITKEEANEQNLEEGIYVTQVELDSPAMTGGIQNGDVIYELEGVDTLTSQQLRTALMEHSEGDTVKVKIKRPGKEAYSIITCEVTLGANRTRTK